MPVPSKPPMLTGYRVLDITQFVAGPTCTRILAELGADVIKVELAPHGDRSRIQGIKPREPKGSSQSTYFFQHNHSKRSLALQWKHPRTTEILKAMVAKADVLVENFAPGVMARAGLDYEDAEQDQSQAGHVLDLGRGPVRASERAAGLRLHRRGLCRRHRPDRRGGRPAGAVHHRHRRCLDRGGRSHGRRRCAAAPRAYGRGPVHRQRHPRHLLPHARGQRAARGAARAPSSSPTRTGSQHPDGGPTGLFRCSDGSYINITALAHQWGQLAAALGKPELVDDPRFKDARARRDNNDQIRMLIEDWLAALPGSGQRTRACWRSIACPARRS